MDLQTKASLHKELLAFLRTKKFLILVCVIIGWSVVSPLMIVGLGLMVDSMSDLYSEFGVDMSGMTEELTSSASLGVASQISDISGVGVIVFLLVINSFAGGEQKKRSIIIPQSAGLSSFSYITPKFIVYPITIFILSFIGTIAAGVVSGFVFDENDLVFTNVVNAGILLGVSNMFYVCIHLTIGTGTGKPRISSAICIGALLLLPGFFVLADANPAFNPFTINTAAAAAVFGNVSSSGMFIGIIVALVLMVALYYIALFAQNARKIDNSGNEVLI